MADSKYGYEELYGDFPELFEPNVILEKEVLSHFGRIFFAFANLEAGLQNCYVFWELEGKIKQGKISDHRSKERAMDRAEKEAFSATLGTLIKLTSKVKELDEARPEIKRIKKKRDYFAHHFFREENKNQHNREAMLFLILEMCRLQSEISMIESSVRVAMEIVFGRLFPGVKVSGAVSDLVSAQRQQYETSQEFTVGWKDYAEK